MRTHESFLISSLILTAATLALLTASVILQPLTALPHQPDPVPGMFLAGYWEAAISQILQALSLATQILLTTAAVLATLSLTASALLLRRRTINR